MNYRRVIRFSGFALGGILFAAALGLLLVHTSPVRKIFYNKLAALLQAQGISFEVADLEYNLFRSSITLRKVVIRSVATPDLPPIAQAEQVSLTVNSWKLLYGTVDIGDAVITRPVIDFVIDERGKNNLPEIPATAETGGSNTYLIRHLLMSRGSLHFEDKRNKIDLRLPGWEATVAGNPESLNHDIRLTMDRPGSIAFENRVLPVDTLYTDALVGMKWAQVRDFHMSSGASRISITGKMKDFKAGVLEAASTGVLQIAPLLEFAGLPPQLAGTLKVDVAAAGPLAAMKVHAKLAGENLSADKFQGLHLDADTTYTMGTPRIDLASLNLSSPAGSIDVSGIVALERAAGNTRLKGRIIGLDLRQVSKIAKLPVSIASRANGSMRLQWPGLSYREAVGDANLRLDASQLSPQKDVVPVSGLIAAKFDGRRITATLDPLQSMGALAQGALNVDLQNRLGGEIRIESPSLGWTLRQLDLFQGNVVKSPPVLDGTARIVAKIGGTLARPTATLEAEASNLNAGSFEGASATATANYDPDALTIEEAVIRWRDQVATAQGVIDLKAKIPTIDVSARIDNGSVANALAGAGMPGIAAQGNFHASAHITGALRDPNAQVSVAAADLHAYGEDLGALSVDALFANDTATITRLRMEKPAGGFVDATGTYNLQSQAYSIAGKIQNFVLDHLTPPGSGPLSGELNASVEGSGTTADPHLNLTVNVKDATVEDRNYGVLAATMRVENHQAIFEATAPNYNLSASGQIGIAPDYPAQLRLDVKALDLAKIPVELQTDLKGTASVALRASGSLTKWEQGEASGSLEADVKWNGEPIRTESPLVFKYGNGLLAIESGTLTATGSTVRVSGSLPVLPSAPDGEIRLQGDFDLSRLPAFVPELALEARGKLVLDATLRGNARKIDPSGAIELTGGYAARPGISPLSNATLSAVLQGGIIQVNKLSADWASSKIESTAEIPLALLPVSFPFELPKTAGPASLKLDVTGLDIASIEGVPAEVKGSVTMHLVAQAPKLELGAITGRLEFERLNLNLAGLPLDRQGTSSIQVRGGVAVVEQFVLAGTGTELRLTGSTDLNGAAPALNLQASGTFDAAIVTSFAQAVKARGPGELRLAVTGTLPQPKVSGYVELSGASVNLMTPKLAADNLNVRVDIEQDQLTIARLEGSMNGGTIAGKGTLRYSAGALQANLDLSANDVYLSFPQGLKTVSNTELTLRNVGESLVLGGKVHIVEGSYTDRVDLGTGLLGYIRSGQARIDTNEEKNTILSGLKFDIGVDSRSPLTINNNLAKAGVNLDLRIAGTYYRPSVVGRIFLEEGGELYFSERKYLVDRGIVSLTNEQRIEPSFDIQAKTQASKYDITLAITGGGSDKLETVFTSDPPLPEPDIMALLLTGRTLEEVRGSEASVAGEQVLSYLAGGIGGRLSGTLQRATGLSQVRIEPNLIAAESDPSARLTVGQNLTKNARLTYSMNLANSGDQIYIAEYDITKRFTTSAIKQSDNSYRFEFRHEVRLGGTAADSAEAKRHPRSVGTVKFEGTSVLTPEQLSKKLKVKAGKTYDFFQVQKGVDRIESAYKKLHRLEARVRLKREQTDRTVDLTVSVNAGPKIEFVYEGWRPSSGVRKRVDSIWKAGVFDSQRVDEAQDAIRAELIKQGRLESKIEHIVSTPTPDVKRIVFDIQPGLQFRNVKVVFAGAAAIKPKKLKALLKAQKLGTDLYAKPDRIVTALKDYYHVHGFLTAEVKPPKLQLDATARSGTVTIPIVEGPLFKVGAVTFVGNSIYSAAALREALPMKDDASYNPAMREESINKLQDLYWSKGYNEVDIGSSIALDRGKGMVALKFIIVEKRQDIIRGIQVAGNKKTSESMIRTQLAVKPGDAMSGEKLSRSRRALYSTGAYSLVDIAKSPVAPEPEAIAKSQAASAQRLMDLTVKVSEVPPFDIRYGGFFDTDRGPGGIVDLRNHNSLGSAREIGLRARYDNNVQEGRIYFGQPLLKRFPLKTTATTFFRREKVDAFLTDKFGATIQQEARFRQHYILNYGYRLENVHTFDKVPDPFFPFDIRLRIAPLTSTLTRETRDDILDATRGSFTSQAFEWAPAALGSQLRFVRYFGQYFKYVPLGKPTEIPWSGGLRKTRLVYAGGVRGGLATGLGGQVLVPSERFFAGGGTTIRGFKQNGLGPIDSFGNAQGGNALFLINNELRFPGIGTIDGVAFADFGNVFKTASEFSLTGLRKTGGAGLRVRTPYFLIRFDYGFKLDRRPGESIGNFFFSIGQAF